MILLPVSEPSVLASASRPAVAAASGATYYPLTPARILDTRNSTGGVTGPIGEHASTSFQITGNGGVPGNATAVTGNLTVTQQTSAGYLYLGPTAANDPPTSTLNFPAGDDRANAVTVALGSGGKLWVTYVAPTAGKTTQVIFDVTGYYTAGTAGATYYPLAPARILDTRNSTGGVTGPIGEHASTSFQITGNGGVPGNATAVTGNLTVTQQTSAGYLYLGPTAANDPPTSTLNFPAGDDRANAVTVALGSGGKLWVTYVAPTAGKTTQVIFDVTGYYTAGTAGATYYPLAPARILDTRNSTGGVTGPIGEHASTSFQITGNGGVPGNATAVTGNLTVTQQTSAGYLYLGPTAANDPPTSTLNFPAGDDRANAVTVALGSGGKLWVTYVAPTAGKTTQVIFDVTGYYTAGGGTDSLVVAVDGIGSAGDAQNRTNVNTGTTPKSPDTQHHGRDSQRVRAARRRLRRPHHSVGQRHHHVSADGGQLRQVHDDADIAGDRHNRELPPSPFGRRSPQAHAPRLDHRRWRSEHGP